MADYTAINLRATTVTGIEEFEIFDHPDADFSPNVDVFLSIAKDLDESDEAFCQVLPPGTDGEYERIDAEYGITRLRGDLPRPDLFVNNPSLGSEEYIGTREDFIKAMTPTPLLDWYDEYQMEVFEVDEHLLYNDWLDHIMDRGLRLATDEEIATFPRLQQS